MVLRINGSLIGMGIGKLFKKWWMQKWDHDDNINKTWGLGKLLKKIKVQYQENGKILRFDRECLSPQKKCDTLTSAEDTFAFRNFT